MKNLILNFYVLFFTLCAYAQNDVTQFLGIPVDGSKLEMIQKLKAKGFQPNALHQDILEGKFNGSDVNISIATNNDKVCRIMVCDADLVDERNIQIRFNRLCQQFENNAKYIAVKCEHIPDDEDISYEISIRNKRYEAAFLQNSMEEINDSTFFNQLMPKILSKYTQEELNNHYDEIKDDVQKIALDYFIEISSKKSVWFMISELYGKYYITLFYDNEYNRANGEDL